MSTPNELLQLGINPKTKRRITIGGKLWMKLQSEYNSAGKLQVNSPVHSPIKWVGGKSRLAKLIVDQFVLTTNYYEPFCGGGAVFIELLQRFNTIPGTMFISDTNPVLIKLFQIIQDDPTDLIASLRTDIDRETYYQLRTEFNEIKTSLTLDTISHFMMLNRSCFRGLYRENKQGNFNVPFGHYKSISYDIDNIRQLHKLLNKCRIIFTCEDYRQSMSRATDRDLIYLDPPYVNTFTDYTADGFDHDTFLKVANSLSAHVVMSNSSNANIPNTFFVVPIRSKQRINSKKPGATMHEILAVKTSVDSVSRLILSYTQLDLNNPILRDWITFGPIFKFIRKNKLKSLEKKWGQLIVGGKTKMWSGFLGERLAELIYGYSGHTEIGRLIIDGETDTHFIEVKTRNYTTSGTAGEKIFYTPIKYGGLPKPLKVVLCAYQEVEFREVFEERNPQILSKYLEFLAGQDIEFVMMSELI